jgi:YD repeat-containing protein
MTDPEDYVLVYGNFTTQSTKDHLNYLTTGTMEIRKDFIQTGYYPQDAYSYLNFRATGTHKVILNGESFQNVLFNYLNSKFNILILTKPYASSYYINPKPIWNRLIEAYRAEAQNGRSNGAHPATGNYSKGFTDLTAASPGFDIAFGRTYNSASNKNTCFGRGWSFSYEGNIENYMDGLYKKVNLPNGSCQIFIANQDGTFTAYDNRNTLVKQSDDSYVLTTKEQISYGYNPNGYLVWMKDRYGNTVHITVDINGRILNVTDQAEREYNISYENGMIKTITDPAGRTVNYFYQNGNLTSVKDPEGSFTYYFYDTEGYLSEIRDHYNNLLESVHIYIQREKTNTRSIIQSILMEINLPIRMIIYLVKQP